MYLSVDVGSSQFARHVLQRQLSSERIRSVTNCNGSRRVTKLSENRAPDRLSDWLRFELSEELVSQRGATMIPLLFSFSVSPFHEGVSSSFFSAAKPGY